MTASRNKWALLIGINKYSLLAPRYQLHGCINDSQLMDRTLQDVFGFPDGNIARLHNEQATREAILQAMHDLVERVKQDDTVVLYYSGHGSQMPDRENDEPDRKDETIVPHDSGRHPYPNRDITDDEIYIWLLELTGKTPYVTLIFDCCNSGTITRDAFGGASRWLEPDDRPLEELPPSPIPKDQADVMRAGMRDIGPSGWLPLGQRYVLIAACRAEEEANEHSIKQSRPVTIHGALTYFLHQELTRAGQQSTYRDVFERASIGVTDAYPRQHPQLEGAADRLLFGVEDIKPMRFVPVRQRRRGKVTLGAGAAHGMTVGSQWAVYPQAIKRVIEGKPRLGLVEISAVGAVTSEAMLLNEASAGAIRRGARAVEETHSYGEMRLSVFIQAPADQEQAAAQLAALLDTSPLLCRKAADEADMKAVIAQSRATVSEGDPVPQLGLLHESAWAVVGRDGRLVMPARPVAEANATDILRDNLEKIARYRQSLALRNPDDILLKDKVQFILKRSMRDGTWAPAEPERAGGQVIFHESDPIAFEITNHHNAPIFVSVLDFGLAGAVSLLYPDGGPSQPLDPGRSITVGERQGEGVELFFPNNFPFVLDPNDDTPTGGIETFKLFATTHEADFTLLLQEGVRSADLAGAKGADSPLFQLLTTALTGLGDRLLWRNRADWTTIERPFVLRRNLS